MKKRLFPFFFILALLSANTIFSQSWVEKMQDPTVNFYDVQKAFNKKYHNKEKEMSHERYEAFVKKQKLQKRLEAKGIKAPKGSEAMSEEDESGEIPGWEIYKRWEDFMKPRVFPSGDRSVMNIALSEYLENYYNGSNTESNGSRGMSGIGGPSTPTVQAANWTIVGPTTSIPAGGGAGRVNFVRFDPTNTSIIWVGSPDGGLWKSTTGGTSWTTSTDNLPLLGCSDLAINPLNNQVMYLATGDGDASDTYSIGVLKSTDGGTTWNASGLNWTVLNFRNVNRLLINPVNPNTIFAATSNGVYRSINAGANWSQISSALANIKDIEYRPGDTTTIYAASTTRFYKSTNGGTTFTNITSGLPATTLVDRLAIAVSAANPAYVYVLASLASDDGFQGLYRSIDNGTTFTTRSTTPNVLGWASAGNDSGGQGWYDLAIAASPTNADLIVVGGVNTWRSSNGGTTWTLNSHWTGSGAPYVHADCHALEFLPGNGTTFFVGCDGGLFKTANTGTSFTDLSNGLQISQPYRLGVSQTNANLLVCGLQDNGTVRWSGTAAWNYIQGGDGMEAIVDWSNASVQYGELYYGEINRTTTGGNLTTTIVSSGGTGVNADGDWVTPYIMNPLKASTLIVGKAQAYRSRNRGTAWASMGTVTGGTGNLIALAYAPADTNYIYMAKMDKFFASTNGGTSFTDRTGTLPVASASISYIAVANNNPAHVWVTFSGYSAANKVWYSADAGVTWTNYTTGLPNLPANCIVYQNGSTNDALYVGTDVGVYYRDNTASTWTAYNSGLPNVIVKELEIQYSAAKLRAATFGRGVWQSDLATPGNSPPVADFSASRTNICVGDCINFTDLSTGTPTSWSWSFPGAATTTSTVQNPTNICYNTAGTYNVTLTATNTNGSNPVTKTAYITVSGTMALPLVEGFQGTFLPAGWARNNPDADNTWAQVTNAGGFANSTSSAMMDNYSPAASIVGTIDDLITPKYSFAGVTSAQMTFDVAYARYNTTYTDSLIVYVSTNCGVSWTQVYSKGGFTGLQTAPDNSTSMFVPTSTQWRTETVNMTPYAGQSNVSVKFTSRSGWGQALYLDNINITAAGASVASVSIAETTGTNPTCAGSSVTFTATPTNGGTAPTYQWQVNGVNAGTNSSTFTTTTLTNGQVVTCIMTSNLAGVTGSPATSNTITMTVNSPSVATFSYTGTPYCQTATNPSPTFSGGGTAGTFTSTTGLSINATTGVVNLAASTPGTYTVTNTKPAAGGCSQVTATSTITITAPAIATFSYTGTPYCHSATNPSPTFSGGGSAGTFTSTAGLVFVSATTGVVNLTASTPGTYTVTNTKAASGGCPQVTATSTITITAPSVATFSYTGTPYCQSATNPSPTFSGGGTAGTFTSTAGLVFISATTGVVNLASSTPGTYTVTNTKPAAGGCSAITATSTITITAPSVATFSYTGSPYCQSGTNPSPTFSGGGSAGTFTSTAGLSINALTGVVNLAASTPGTFTVTNTKAAAGGCPQVTATSTITITAPAVATFGYTGSPYCKTATNPSPTFSGGGTAGTFTSTTGLSINATTGVVNLAASTPGTYTVTNTKPAAGGCPQVTATSTITITAPAIATFSYTGTPYCQSATNPSPTFSGGGSAGTFTSTTGLVFVSATTGVVNLTASTPGTYTVTNTKAAAGGCPSVTATSTITITVPSVATFSYTGTPYCQNATNPSPTFSSGGSAGTFTSTAGLSINASTGVVNLAASTAGTYTVTNTKAASGACPSVTATSTITITVPSVATFSYTGTPYCQSATNPSPTFSGGGSAGTFTSTAGLSINAATGFVNLAASTPGTYTVTNTKPAAGGCPAITATSSIAILSGPTAQAVTTASTGCGASTGTITVGTTTGGTGPYTYSVNGSGFTTTTSYTALAAGSYPVIVKDANGCTFSTTATVSNSSGPTAQASTTINSTCGNSNGSITLGATTGGTGPYTYSVNGSAFTTATSYTGLSAGTYSVIVKDAGACQFTTSVVVANTAGPSTSVTTTNAICGGANGSATVSVSGGTPGYSYSWAPAGGTTAVLSNATAGSYTVAVIDNNGCTSTSVAAISDTPGPSAQAVSSTNSNCGGTDGTITVGATTDGTAPYMYSVNGSAASTNTSYSGFAAGNYPVVVTDGNGCSFSTTVSVGNTGTTPATPTITQSGSTLTSSSATGNQWYENGVPVSGETGQTFTFTANGNYSVVVTNGGCSSAASAVMAVTNVGITEAADPYRLLIYPNPNDGHFIFSFTANDRSTYRVEIVNALGQLIFRDDLKDFSGSYKKEMSVVEYGQGIYTISLTNSKNETVKKIVVY